MTHDNAFFCQCELSRSTLWYCLRELDQKNSTVTTSILPADLTKREAVDSIVAEVNRADADIQRGILVSNAGSLGELGAVDTLQDYSALQSSCDLNMTNFMWTISSFTHNWKEQYPSVRLDIVNISSLNAVEAFPSFGVYCSVKAARDMFLNVAAKDFKSSGSNIYVGIVEV